MGGLPRSPRKPAVRIVARLLGVVHFISNRRKRRDDSGRRSLDGRCSAAPLTHPRQKVAVAGSGPMRPLGESSASIFLMSSPSSLKSNTPMFSFNRSSRTVFGITIRPLSRCRADDDLRRRLPMFGGDIDEGGLAEQAASSERAPGFCLMPFWSWNARRAFC